VKWQRTMKMKCPKFYDIESCNGCYGNGVGCNGDKEITEMKIRTKIKQKDGTWKYVYGWYFAEKQILSGFWYYIIPDDAGGFLECDESHNSYTIGPAYRIDPSHTSVVTGKKDKNGVEIFGSKGEFRDGEIVSVGGVICSVEWWEDQLCWALRNRETLQYWSGLSEYDELEIIPNKQEPMKEPPSFTEQCHDERTTPGTFGCKTWYEVLLTNACGIIDRQAEQNRLRLDHNTILVGEIRELKEQIKSIQALRGE